MKEFDKRVWYQIFQCPVCKSKTHVTDVCRQCSETPADDLANRPVYCDVHKTYHYVGNKPTIHRNVTMIPTEWMTRFNPNILKQERRKIKNLSKEEFEASFIIVPEIDRLRNRIRNISKLEKANMKLKFNVNEINTKTAAREKIQKTLHPETCNT